MSRFLLICLSLLAGCAAEPAPARLDPAETVVRYDATSRVFTLKLARDCGADPVGWVREAGRFSVPRGFSPEQVRAYDEAFAAAMAQGGPRLPAEAECRAIRGRAAYAALFPRPPEREERDVPAVRKASYCADGSMALRSDPTLSAGQDALRTACRPGDTIIVPAVAVGVIASACDLSRPILSTGDNVFCTLGRIRTLRRVEPAAHAASPGGSHS